jgi:hypothetical protein
MPVLPLYLLECLRRWMLMGKQITDRMQQPAMSIPTRQARILIRYIPVIPRRCASSRRRKEMKETTDCPAMGSLGIHTEGYYEGFTCQLCGQIGPKEEEEEEITEDPKINQTND